VAFEGRDYPVVAAPGAFGRALVLLGGAQEQGLGQGRYVVGGAVRGTLT